MASRPQERGQPLHLHEQGDEPLPFDARDVRAGSVSLLRRLAVNNTTRRALRTSILLLLDIIAIAAALASALAIKGLFLNDVSVSDAISGARSYLPVACLVTVLIFTHHGFYGARETRPGLSQLVTALLQATIILLVFALISGSRFNSYWTFYGSFLLAAVYVSMLRLGYASVTGHLLSKIGYRRRTVLVGTGKRLSAIASALGESRQDAYEVLGYFALDSDGIGRDEISNLPDLGTLEDFSGSVAGRDVHEVIIADPDLPQQTAVKLIDDSQALGLRVRIAPSTVEVLTKPAAPVPGMGVALFDVRPPDFRGVDFLAKRVFDFIIAAFILLLLSPFLLVIALAVKLTSRGPVLHHSLRPGVGGQPFHCLKFRTMYEGAERRQHELEHLNEADGAIFKIRDDPRATPVGRFLRTNSVDELPQLINVLRGEMSLVGPRPLPLRDHARLEDWHRRRYSVLPGVTGLWQISGRSDLDFDDMVRLDFLYIERWSVMLDFLILLKTVPAVFRRRGAY